jgi:hypothetical protein
MSENKDLKSSGFCDLNENPIISALLVENSDLKKSLEAAAGLHLKMMIRGVSDPEKSGADSNLLRENEELKSKVEDLSQERDGLNKHLTLDRAELKMLTKDLRLQLIDATNKIERLTSALELYADKKNWKRTESGALRVFIMDSNGPYFAFRALHEED